MTEEFKGVDLSEKAEVRRVLDAAIENDLQSVFVVGLNKDGQLVVAGSGDEKRAIWYVAELLHHIAEGHLE